MNDYMGSRCVYRQLFVNYILLLHKIANVLSNGHLVNGVWAEIPESEKVVVNLEDYVKGSIRGIEVAMSRLVEMLEQTDREARKKKTCSFFMTSEN